MFRNLFLAVLAIGLIAAIATVGCGPRVEVAKDKVIKEIDKLLGELDVKQKDIQMKLGKVKEAAATIREKRIEAKIQLANLEKKRENLEAQIKKHTDNLASLKPMLKEASEASDGVIERNGRKVSKSELNSMATSTMKQIDKLKDQLKNRITTLTNAWAKNLDLLKRQDDTNKESIKKLEDRLEEIASKKSAVDAIREASSISEPGISINDKFDELNTRKYDVFH